MTEASADESIPSWDEDSTPPGEHGGELPDEGDDAHTGPLQEENAGTTEDQPSQ